MTTSLTLRSVKGAALTHSEVDGNFTALRSTADAAAAPGLGTGLPLSNGTAFTGVKTSPSGTIVGTTDTQSLSAKTLIDAILQGALKSDEFTISDGASVAINPSDGDVQLWTLGASRTPTLTSITAGKGVLLGIDDGTAYTLTLSGVTWINNGGSAPTLKTTGRTWILVFNLNSTLYAALIGDGG